MDKEKMPMTLEEALHGVSLSIKGGEKGITANLAGNGIGMIVGISMLAHQIITQFGIPLETIASGIIASPTLMWGRTVASVDLSKLPPDTANRLRKA